MSIPAACFDLYNNLQTCNGAQHAEELVKGYLDKGHAADVEFDSVGNFESLLGFCCGNLYLDAARRLLEAGASPHWSSGELTQEDLGYDDDDRYDGPCVDSLARVMDLFGENIVAAAESETKKDALAHLDAAQQALSVARLLLDYNADPIRPDPAHGFMPFDQANQQIANCDAMLPERGIAMLAEFFVDCARACNELDKVRAGRAEQVSFTYEDWEDLPHVGQQIVAFAQSIEIDETTPRVSTPSSLRRM